MIKCILIKTNFEYEIVELPEDDTFDSEVHKMLDCEFYDEAPGYCGTYLIFDESGNIKSPPKKPNMLASFFYSSAFLFNFGILYGDVLILNTGYDSQGESNFISLSDFQFNKVLTTVCVSTIYNYIDKGIFANITIKNLTRQGKMKGKPRQARTQKRAPAGQSIEKRAQHINNRQEFGHWEMDTVIGQKTRGQILLVLTERKTRYQMIFKMKDKTAKSTVLVLNRLERRFRSKFSKIFKTITVDNGTEFSACFDLEQSCIRANHQRTTMYYCHPYSSWERGSNENQNAFIRRFIPKGHKIEQYSEAYIQKIADFINDYPRRLFGYSSASDLFSLECSNL